MNSDIQRIKEKISPVLRKAGVSRSSLFGSFARGKNNATSDVDILIEPPHGMSLIDLVGLQMEVEQALGRKTDLVTYKALSPYLRENVLREAITIL